MGGGTRVGAVVRALGEGGPGEVADERAILGDEGVVLDPVGEEGAGLGERADQVGGGAARGGRAQNARRRVLKAVAKLSSLGSVSVQWWVGGGTSMLPLVGRLGDAGCAFGGVASATARDWHRARAREGARPDEPLASLRAVERRRWCDERRPATPIFCLARPSYISACGSTLQNHSSNIGAKRIWRSLANRCLHARAGSELRGRTHPRLRVGLGRSVGQPAYPRHPGLCAPAQL